jgi:hypothetical protein
MLALLIVFLHPASGSIPRPDRAAAAMPDLLGNMAAATIVVAINSRRVFIEAHFLQSSGSSLRVARFWNTLA